MTHPEIVHCQRHPHLERLPVVIKLRAYFEAMAAIGPVPDHVHVWTEQLDQLLTNGGAERVTE